MSLSIKNFRVGRVIDLHDEQGGDRIKVALEPVDNFKSSVEEIDYAIPCLPKFLHIKPKLEERVLVITEDPSNPDSQRFYFGPIISQENKLEGDTNPLQALSLFRGNDVTPEINPRLKSEAKGAFPEDEHISIEGRKNAGIQLTDDDVRIKAGVKLVDNTDVVFNTKDPAYIKLKYHKDDSKKTTDYNSTAIVVADKINLIGPNGEYNVTDRKDLVSDEDMDNIIKKAHQVPYGDVLIDFMKLFVDAFNKHTHAMSMDPPVPDANLVNLNTKVEQLNKTMLSDVVRIN